MDTRDRRVDAYIARSPEFARPILKHFREAVHEACPEAEETLKWKMPTFMYKGMLCGPSHRRDYIEWITEAKTDATRDRRLATAIEWMSEGKGRNWKYERRA